MTRLWVVALGALWLTEPAIAADPVPQIYQLSCDTLSTNPLQVRIGFGVLNLDPAHGLCGFFFVPQPGGSSHVLACSTSVSRWECSISPDGWPYWTVSTDPPDCMRPGERRESFFLVSDSSSPCYFARFTSPIGEFGDQNFCFTCDMEIPIRPSTWGRIKAVYR